MKAFENLTYKDKNKIIHQLFPDEIPLLLEYIKQYCNEFDANNVDCENLMPFDELLFVNDIFSEMLKLLNCLQEKMARSYHIFADQMSYPRISILFNELLLRYATGKSENLAFRELVSLFYNVDSDEKKTGIVDSESSF